MSALEEEYLTRVSHRLRNFKRKQAHTFNFSCPICGDSKKKKYKARGYAYTKEGNLLVCCYNCGYSTNFPNFLKELDLQLFEEFRLERFKNTAKRNIRTEDERDEMTEKIFNVPATKKYRPNIFDGLPALVDLDDDHEAMKVATSRLLPIGEREFFFVEKFFEWTQGHSDKFEDYENFTTPDHPRIIIPFKARDGHYIGYSARAIHGEEPKYYRIFIDEDEKEKFYGIDLLDESKQVYVLEGEIDSMFLPNAIAVSNGKLDIYMNKDAIYIPDADKRNPHIVKGIEKLLDKGLKVCLIPENLPGKDLNDLARSGLTIEEITDIVNQNVWQGLKGKLKFNSWKKV